VICWIYLNAQVSCPCSGVQGVSRWRTMDGLLIRYSVVFHVVLWIHYLAVVIRRRIRHLLLRHTELWRSLEDCFSRFRLRDSSCVVSAAEEKLNGVWYCLWWQMSGRTIAHAIAWWPVVLSVVHACFIACNCWNVLTVATLFGDFAYIWLLLLCLSNIIGHLPFMFINSCKFACMFCSCLVVSYDIFQSLLLRFDPQSALIKL
jgi:hypothetical protein